MTRVFRNARPRRATAFGGDHSGIVNADITEHCAQVRIGVVHRFVFTAWTKPVTAAASDDQGALGLAPRLGRFYAAHRGINLRLDTPCEVDLVSRYSLGDYPNLCGQCLLDENVALHGSRNSSHGPAPRCRQGWC